MSDHIKKHMAKRQIQLGHGQAGISVDETLGKKSKKQRKQARTVGAEGARNMMKGAAKLTALRKKAQTTDSNN